MHDPTGIIKSGDTYWIFSTGSGIPSWYSRDLVKWTAGKTPLTPGSYPSWIKTYVPEFNGHFWAPDCFYMNGLYHLYYSCSSWGSKNSCIGLMVSKSLNPESADYGWSDKGVVVFSSDASSVNCIDPAVFRDKEGKIWLTYGSHWDGIRIIELDSINGKVIGGTHHPVAGKGDYKTEASYVINHDKYYYLFINRGQCCEGVNSTYYIQVGRSESPTGPYLDKTGKDLYNGGGSTVLSTSGSMIGPGCLGYFSENGTEYVTYHYYDGERSGTASLNIARLSWVDDWPVISTNWIEEGDYFIQNMNSRLYWNFLGSGEALDPVIQDAFTENSTQKWTFSTIGNGYYYISPAGFETVAKLKDCFGATGTKIDLGIPEMKSCQFWRVEKTNRNGYILSSKYGNRVLEVPESSTDAGTQLEANIHTGGNNQRWTITENFQTGATPGDAWSASQVKLYPNPLRDGPLFIALEGIPPARDARLEIISFDGRLIYSGSIDTNGVSTISTGLEPRVYIVHIRINDKSYFSKLSVQ